MVVVVAEASVVVESVDVEFEEVGVVEELAAGVEELVGELAVGVLAAGVLVGGVLAGVDAEAERATRQARVATQRNRILRGVDRIGSDGSETVSG